MIFCLRFVVLNRPYTTNTQQIWKWLYPTEAWESHVAPVIIFFFYFAFLIDIIDNIITYSPYSPYYVTRTSTNGSAVYWSRDTVLYQFLETWNQIDVLYIYRSTPEIHRFHPLYTFSFLLYSPFKARYYLICGAYYCSAVMLISFLFVLCFYYLGRGRSMFLGSTWPKLWN